MYAIFTYMWLIFMVFMWVNIPVQWMLWAQKITCKNAYLNPISDQGLDIQNDVILEAGDTFYKLPFWVSNCEISTGWTPTSCK